MSLDLLEKKTLQLVAIVSFLVFIFLPLGSGMKIFLLSMFSYFLIIFFLATYWSKETHPEIKFLIGFLVSVFHTFVFLFGGLLGLALAQLFLKIYPFLINYFRGI
jgi:hypothetical protein